jgi:hypothetical protein
MTDRETAQETVVSTSKPAPSIASTARQRARRILRPLLFLVLVLRCVAALPPHRGGNADRIDRQGALGRLITMAAPPVQSADQ